METDEITLINEIMPRLNAERADNYNDWLNVGMALYHSGATVDIWENWSKQSGKYTPGLCESKWKSFSSNSGASLGLGSLVAWARLLWAKAYQAAKDWSR